VSSVGGWIATRAAGQFSTGYGNIEDIVLALEAVLPNGEILETRRTPRASSGPDLRTLLLGSEGTLGVITGVTLSLRRQPETRAASAFHLDGMAAGFELQREIVQRGWQPVVMRQYDATEAERMFSAYARANSALLLLAHEGPAARVAAETAAIAAIAQGLGAAPASPEAVTHWLSERNKVPTFKSFLEGGIILDTIEIAATWDRIEEIYRRSLDALRQVPGMLAASAHSSHVYRSGLNLYFTFVARPSRSEDMRATYLEAWNAVLRVTVESGGGIAHHHGIGRVRRDWLEREIGATGVGALRALKSALDPTGFMNPGALLPE
jgi:alkyldihydroxyacetonephosphate synthase